MHTDDDNQHQGNPGHENNRFKSSGDEIAQGKYFTESSSSLSEFLIKDLKENKKR
ncbi:MAG: hypothetical protein WCJ45_04070 [bacterium]